jgi:hypothetical protein
VHDADLLSLYSKLRLDDALNQGLGKYLTEYGGKLGNFNTMDSRKLSSSRIPSSEAPRLNMSYPIEASPQACWQYLIS